MLKAHHAKTRHGFALSVDFLSAKNGTRFAIRSLEAGWKLRVVSTWWFDQRPSKRNACSQCPSLAMQQLNATESAIRWSLEDIRSEFIH